MSFASLWVPLLLSSLALAKDLVLKPGETHVLPATGRAWVEKSKVLKLRDVGHGFMLRGQSPGFTTLKIGAQTFDVSVLSPSQERAWRLLQPAVGQTLGLRLGLSRGAVRVQGDLLRWQDWEKLYRACQNRDCEYLMEAKLKPLLKQSVQNEISKLFQQHGLPPQNLMFDSQVQALVSYRGEISQRVTKLLKALGVHPVNASGNLDLEPLIKVQITVAEIRKSETLNYGIKWPPSYQAQILPKLSADGVAAIDIQFLEKQGLAKILASPNIICRSGKDAHFFAGGEFPIKILNYKVQDIVWKKYGILLKVHPQADFSGKMSIAIETEVSSIDPSINVDGVPGLFSNKMQSHFDLNESRLIALSGLIKNEQAHNSSGLPGLTRLPVLGALFASKEFIDNRTELVVFVKPEVISPGTLEAEP